MVKRKKNNHINRSNNITKDKSGLYIWIGIFIIGTLLFNFFEEGWPIFGGIILLAIIFRLWKSGSSGI